MDDSNDRAHDDALADLNRQLAAMPPVAALAIRATGLADGRLRLRAPLAANVNDKGCAFGGSLAGLMTLAGWGLLTLKLGDAGIDAEVYVADSQVRYLKPLYADLEAEARLAPDTDWEATLRAFRERGRARATVQARVLGPGDEPVADLAARFAALRA